MEAAADVVSLRQQVLYSQRFLAEQLREWDRVLELTDELEALVQGPGDYQNIHVQRAVTHAGLGNEAESRRALGAFFELISEIEIPPALERSVRGQVEGAIAYARGDWAEAAERFRVGLEDMPDRRTSEQAITIRYHLARALERLDRPDDAAEQYRAVVEARLQRLGPAIFWVRSLDHLASILDARGDAAEAERLWERYLDHWGDGEIDGERVAEVRARLS